jgi:hypothetical protein
MWLRNGGDIIRDPPRGVRYRWEEREEGGRFSRGVRIMFTGGSSRGSSSNSSSVVSSSSRLGASWLDNRMADSSTLSDVVEPDESELGDLETGDYVGREHWSIQVKPYGERRSELGYHQEPLILLRDFLQRSYQNIFAKSRQHR